MRLELRSSFNDLEGPWEALRSRSNADHLFLSYAWQSLWWSLFGAGRDLHLILLWDGDDLAGLAPLYREDGVLRLIGGADLTDYLDLIYRSDAAEALVSGLANHLAEAGQLSLDLLCVPAGSPTLDLLRARNDRDCLWVTVAEHDVCPVVDLPPNWEAYLTALTKKDRHELRRKLRRLEGQTGVRRVMLTDLPSVRAALPEFFRLHLLSRPAKQDFLTPDVQQFFEALAEEFVPRGIFQLHFLEIAGRRVSAVICFAQEEQLWLYNSGYDPDYRQLSVGLLLKALCLQGAIESGYRRFDFLRGREPYKYDLGGVDQPVYRIRVARGEAGE